MASKVNFSTFSKSSNDDENLYIVGYDSNRRDSAGRYERRIPIRGLKFVDGGILFKADEGTSDRWYKLTINEVVEDNEVKQYYIDLTKVS